MSMSEDLRRIAWQTLADHQWRDWQCSCGKVKPEAREYEDNHLADEIAAAMTDHLAAREAAAEQRGRDAVLADVERVLAEVHRRHGIWGFNGSQVRCQCGPTWFQTTDWYAHVAAEQAAALRALPTGGER